MGITINQPFPFSNLPPQSNVYVALGTGIVGMNMMFDDSNVRIYTLDLISKYWLNKDMYDKGFEPVMVQTGSVQGTIQQLANISAFFHDSAAAGLAVNGITDVTIDYINN